MPQLLDIFANYDDLNKPYIQYMSSTRMIKIRSNLF